MGTLSFHSRFIPPYQTIKLYNIQMLQFIKHIIFQIWQAFFAAKASYQGEQTAMKQQQEIGIFEMQILH